MYSVLGFRLKTVNMNQYHSVGKQGTFLLFPVPIAQMVEHPLREREVVGSNPGRAIPKALKMVPVATLLGAQHYKASTGSPLTHY